MLIRPEMFNDELSDIGSSDRVKVLPVRDRDNESAQMSIVNSLYIAKPFIYMSVMLVKPPSLKAGKLSVSLSTEYLQQHNKVMAISTYMFFSCSM